MRLLLFNRKALTPVVASIILCGVVLTVGISVWSLTYSITRSLEDDYYEKVKRQIDIQIIEDYNEKKIWALIKRNFIFRI